MADSQESAPLQLQPVLRLIHCIQKERGASCAMVGSLSQSKSKSNKAGSTLSSEASEEHPYGSNLRSARIASNSAISSFYRSAIWCDFVCGGGTSNGINGKSSSSSSSSNLDIATMLFNVRQMVDGGVGVGDEDDFLFFHDAIVEYNSFLSSIVRVFVVNEVANRKKELQRKITSPKVLNESRRNAKVALSLLDLILSFVTLKESLGMERAALSGLMANGIDEKNDENSDIEMVKDESSDVLLVVGKEQDDARRRARLNLVVNDLVMVVESQHLIMRDLRKQTGLDIRGSVTTSFTGTPEVNELLFDENYRTLLQLVGDSIRPSDAMLSLQELIKKDFDVEGFQQAMTMEEFWAGITLYMNELHSMELFLLEELENCEGSFEDLDLLALGKSQPSQPALSDVPLSSNLSFGDVSQENVLEAVNGMSSEEMKTALVSFLTKKHKRSQSLTSPNTIVRKELNSRAPSPPKTREHEQPALEEWEISLYDVEFHKRIGRGSAGTTYLAKYCRQDVAVKVAATSQMGLEGWTTELMSLKKMHHTNIIRFMGAIYNPSPLTYCLVLEYCDGGDLSAALAGNTPPKFFTDVATGVANGVYYLHKMKYMHRDIKPSNVLLSGDVKSGKFVAKLTDFGLAVKVQNVSVSAGKKELTAETGTYRYMAPEVIRHECYNYTADVYSFGLLMWEIITREKPFQPKSQIEAAGSVALEGKRPPFPKDTPPIVRALIEQCWADKPDQRMGVEEIIKCLGNLHDNVSAQAWLAAPTGYPVYKAVVVDKPENDEVNNSDNNNGKQVPQKKKASMLRKSGSFWKKKK